MISKELERAGLPTAHVCTMTPISLMIGANRIVTAAGIVHPVGDAGLDPEGEKALRREIVNVALEALQKDVSEQTLFRRSVL